MKKILSFLCLSLVILTAFTGCGTKNTNTSSSSAVSQEGEETATGGETVTEGETTTSGEAVVEEGSTRTVSTAMGDVEVPLNPERVVANWYVGDVITLGMNLAGYYAWAQETMPFYEELTQSVAIESWEPEEVMTLNPDLIITYDEADYDKFSKIAPVLVISESEYTPKERLTLLGEATGHSEEASAAIEEFETKLAAVKETLNSDAFYGKTFSILQDWGSTGEWSGVAYETGSRGGTLVYEYLGLEMPEKLKELIEESGEGRGTLSYEVAHEYFGDYILWFLQEDMESEYAQMEVFKSIPAVKEGNLAEIPGKYMGLFYYSDVTSLTAQLDYMGEVIKSFEE